MQLFLCYKLYKVSAGTNSNSCRFPRVKNEPNTSTYTFTYLNLKPTRHKSWKGTSTHSYIYIYIYTHIPSQLIYQNFRVKWFECASVFKAATNFKDGFRLFSGTITVHSTEKTYFSIIFLPSSWVPVLKQSNFIIQTILLITVSLVIQLKK